MTLSNFDWTDKKTIKWFIMLGAGHEGPYSYENLQILFKNNKIALDSRIWSEGLAESITFAQLQYKIEGKVDEEDVPPLPPLPQDEIPEIPQIPTESEETLKIENKNRWAFYLLGVSFFAVIIYLLLNQWIASKEKFQIARVPKMSLELHERISKDFSFQGWDKDIFFKEFVSSDLSHIWLVTSSFQSCDIEVSFHSIVDKLLMMNDEKIVFSSQSKLKSHLVQFNKFDFKSGHKIIPGMYEMNLKATNCEWDGLIPKIANNLKSPDETYIGRMKVILYPGGPVEFNQVLEKLLNKKLEIILKEKGQIELFWQDLQQKLQTLLAISLQIEHLMVDFLDKGESKFLTSLKPMVDQYTKKYGHFLTNFVVANENYFKELKLSSKDVSKQKDYELMIRLTAKKVGLESMKILEEWMAIKKRPTKLQIQNYKEKVNKTFTTLKEEINRKIIQISEDRSL